MKRQISIVFIMFANMLILAHSVVPHHHHSKVFKAIIDVLDEDTRNGFNHEHELFSHNDIDVLFVSALSVKSYKSNFLSLDVLDICAVNELQHLSEKYVNIRYHISNGGVNYIVQSFSLRAPPLF